MKTKKYPAYFYELEGEEDFSTTEVQPHILDEISINRPKDGSLIKATVLGFRDDLVVVDASSKQEGLVYLREFTKAPEIGQVLELVVEKFETKLGNFVLSFEKAQLGKVQDLINESIRTGESVEGTVISKIKGGFIVDLGLKAFVPNSHAYKMNVGDVLPFKVLKNNGANNIIASRKFQAALDKDSKPVMTDKYKEDMVVTGVVKNLTNYGAFIDLGEMVGLLHVGDISRKFIKDPAEVLKVGQEVTVKITKVDEKGRLFLSMKQLETKTEAPKKYEVGELVKGTVKNFTTYGAFIKLGNRMDGLLHIVEMSNSFVKDPAELLKVGQEITTKIVKIDEKGRVFLSLKQVEEKA